MASRKGVNLKNGVTRSCKMFVPVEHSMVIQTGEKCKPGQETS